MKKNNFSINKKIFALFMVLVLFLAPMFAEAGATADAPDAVIKVAKNFRAVAFGAIPGLLIAAKFVFDIVSSYMDNQRGPEKRNKAIIGLVITLGILGLFVVIVNYLFADASTSQAKNIFSAFTKGE